MQSSIAFLKDPDYWSEKIQDAGLAVIPIFKKIPFYLKPFRILHFRYNFPGKNIWYGNWESSLQKFDLIILSASDFTPSVAKYIGQSKLKDDVRLIYWYWNPVRPKYSPDKISDNWEKWSFDKNDCTNFHLKYNSTYYFNSIQIRKQEPKFDVFFIGQNKGRLNDLLKLESVLQKLKITSYFHIVSDNKIFRNKNLFQKKIAYTGVLELIGETKCILEMLQKNQSGLTLRSMESIFFKKKLITNNESISGYRFYRKENIFILGVDDLTHLKDFVMAPYKELEVKIVSQYTFEEWTKRILNNIELNDEFQERIFN